MFGKSSVTYQRSGEKPEIGAVEWTKVSLCRNKALVETLDLFAISLKIVNVVVAIVLI